MQTTTKSPSLIQHQEALERIYKMDSLAELAEAPKMLKEYTHLKPNQIEALLNVIKRQKDVIQEPSPTRIEQLTEEYKEIDKENFWPTEVKITSTGLPNEYKEITISQPIPLAEAVTEVISVIPEKKKQKRVSTTELLEEAKQAPTPVIKEVTVSRRINLPIEWVQYSNNEFNITVTATNKDDAVNELNKLMESFLADQWLVRKSVHDKMVADLKAKQVTPAPQPDNKVTKQYERLKALMNYVYQNSSNKEEMTKLREEFTQSNPIIQ